MIEELNSDRLLYVLFTSLFMFSLLEPVCEGEILLDVKLYHKKPESEAHKLHISFSDGSFMILFNCTSNVMFGSLTEPADGCYFHFDSGVKITINCQSSLPADEGYAFTLTRVHLLKVQRNFLMGH